MSAKPTSLPPELFGGVGMDGIEHNTLLLIEEQRREIARLTAKNNEDRTAVAKLILSFCDGRDADLNHLYGSGWNSAMCYVKSRIQKEILTDKWKSL